MDGAALEAIANFIDDSERGMGVAFWDDICRSHSLGSDIDDTRAGL